MEKIQLELDTGSKAQLVGALWRVEANLNELIDHLTLLDKLAIRVARLEVYYKAHRKEHTKNAK